MPALRCSNCLINWPHDLTKYRKCPSCEGRTYWSGGSVALPGDEAWTMKTHYEFDRFLLARDAERQSAFERVVDGVELDEPVQSD